MRDLARAEKRLALAAPAGVEAESVEREVTDVASGERWFAAAPPIDILDSNAGIAWNAAVEEVEIDLAQRVFEANKRSRLPAFASA